MPLYVLASIRLDYDLFRSVDVYRGAFFSIYLLLAITRDPRIHKGLAALHLALLTLFVANQIVLRSLTC